MNEPARIWYQSAIDPDESPVYIATLQNYLTEIAGPGIEFEVHGISPPQRGFDVPAKQDDVWLPAKGHETAGGATRAPSRVPKALSDTSWTIEHGLAYLKGVETQDWFLHLGFFRPHPPFIAPAPYNERYHPDEVPPPVRSLHGLGMKVASYPCERATSLAIIRKSMKRSAIDTASV